MQIELTPSPLSHSVRDSSVVSLQVTVAARSSLTVNLTYEELLTRRRGQYHHAISIDPGQVRGVAYLAGGGSTLY